MHIYHYYYYFARFKVLIRPDVTIMVDWTENTNLVTWVLCVQVCGIKSFFCPTWLSSSSCPSPTSLQRPRDSQGPRR